MGVSSRDVICFLIGIFAGIIVAYLLKIGIMNCAENFANKSAMAREINEKVGGDFNERKENYKNIKEKIDYYDAVMYGNMKKLRNKQGYVDAESIEKVI